MKRSVFATGRVQSERPSLEEKIDAVRRCRSASEDERVKRSVFAIGRVQSECPSLEEKIEHGFETMFSRHSMVLKPGDRPADTLTDGQADGAAASVGGGLTRVDLSASGSDPAPDGKSEDDAGGFPCSIICFGE